MTFGSVDAGNPVCHAGGLFFGIGSIFARLGLQHIKPMTGTFISMVSSLVLIGLLSLLTDFEATVSPSATALLWFGMIGVINFVAGRQFNYLSIRKIGVTKAGPIFASNPLFAMVLAVTFLGETITVLTIIGTLCVVVGLSLVVTSE